MPTRINGRAARKIPVYVVRCTEEDAGPELTILLFPTALQYLVSQSRYPPAFCNRCRERVVRENRESAWKSSESQRQDGKGKPSRRSEGPKLVGRAEKRRGDAW